MISLLFSMKCKGSRPYTTGEMNSAQFGAIVGQVNLAHQPPMVRLISVQLQTYYQLHKLQTFHFVINYLSLELKENLTFLAF